VAVVLSPRDNCVHIVLALPQVPLAFMIFTFSFFFDLSN
jgi:hypothetical protein